MSEAIRARVSAVITAYNSAAFIAEAIESVLAQTRLPDEVLVVDDGSTDGTGQLVSRYQGKGVRYLYQPNQGAGAARNQGILNTQGDFIAFLDADDLWLADKTRCQLKAMLVNPQATLVSGQRIWWNIETGKRWPAPVKARGAAQGRRDILVDNWIGNPSMLLLRRSILDQVGSFDPSLRWGQDWELWIRILARYEVVILPDPVIIYRSHSDNLSHAGRWERLACFWEISRKAIAVSQPAWRRPAMWVRSWSHMQLQRAETARWDGRSRRVQALYASLALLSNPFEESRAKAIMLVRSLAGEGKYQQIRRAFKALAGRGHG